MAHSGYCQSCHACLNHKSGLYPVSNVASSNKEVNPLNGVLMGLTARIARSAQRNFLLSICFETLFLKNKTTPTQTLYNHTYVLFLVLKKSTRLQLGHPETETSHLSSRISWWNTQEERHGLCA